MLDETLEILRGMAAGRIGISTTEKPHRYFLGNATKRTAESYMVRATHHGLSHVGSRAAALAIGAELLQELKAKMPHFLVHVAPLLDGCEWANFEAGILTLYFPPSQAGAARVVAAEENKAVMMHLLGKDPRDLKTIEVMFDEPAD